MQPPAGLATADLPFALLRALFWPTVLATGAILFYVLTYPYYQRLRLPPGPRPLPLLGNLHQSPLTLPWLTFQEWHRKYGPLVSLQFGQRTVILLGSHRVARDLLEKRKENYSSRPRMVVADESVAKGLNPGLLPYNDRFKAHHRLQSALLSPRLVQSYQYAQEVESRQLLVECLKTPADGFQHLQRYVTSYMFTLAYGKRIDAMDHPDVQDLLEFTEQVSAQMDWSTFLVEALPALDRLPRWLAPWKAMGDRLHQGTLRLFTKNMRDGQASPHWNWSRYAPAVCPAELDDRDRAFALGTLLEAAIDTTLGTLKVFLLASVLHGDAVRRAQEELDRVVGAHRLPGWDDRGRLPYVNSFIKEVLRWRPILPAGVPHSPLHDDVYQGYHIPAGAVIVPCHWSLDMDERLHADPATFCPDRWLENPHVPLAAFGFGRRTCLGRSSALNGLFVAVARCLWAFDIQPAVDEHGETIPVDPFNLVANATAPPAPFPFSMTVRSARHREVLEHEWLCAPSGVDQILEEVERLQNPPV